MPAAQFLHDVPTPVVDEYVPAGQETQAVLAVAPTVVENVPVGQLRHAVEADAPDVVEYVPDTQLTQVPAEVHEPAAHARQACNDDVAPVTDEI